MTRAYWILAAVVAAAAAGCNRPANYQSRGGSDTSGVQSGAAPTTDTSMMGRTGATDTSRMGATGDTSRMRTGADTGMRTGATDTSRMRDTAHTRKHKGMTRSRSHDTGGARSSDTSSNRP